MSAERPQHGFTLVEVMVALAIVALSFVAMYGSAQQVVSATTLQQDKTFASWVAFDKLTELRLGQQPTRGDRQSGEVEMAGTEWRYVVEFEEIDNPYIRQAIVKVSRAETPDEILAVTMGVLLKQARPPGTQNSGALLRSSSDATANNGQSGSGDPTDGSNAAAGEDNEDAGIPELER